MDNKVFGELAVKFDIREFLNDGSLKDGVGISRRQTGIKEGEFPSDWPFHTGHVPERNYSVVDTGTVERREIYFAKDNSGEFVLLTPVQRPPYWEKRIGKTVNQLLTEKGISESDLEALIVFDISRWPGRKMRTDITYWEK